MRELKVRIPRVATSPFPVVIEGESCTGKELIARAIHEEGPRRWAVFVPANCAVLGDEDLRVVAATNRPAGRRGGGRPLPQGRALPPRVRRAHPPLRGRGPDVARLTDHYWKEIAAAAGTRAPLARETVTALAAHSWPGNVRELQSVLANLTVTGPRYGRVGPDALPSTLRRTVAAERRPTLAEAREDVERAMVRDALGRHRSVARAAGELGVTRQGLSKLMARLQVDRFNPARDRAVGGTLSIGCLPDGRGQPPAAHSDREVMRQSARLSRRHR